MKIYSVFWVNAYPNVNGDSEAEYGVCGTYLTLEDAQTALVERKDKFFDDLKELFDYVVGDDDSFEQCYNLRGSVDEGFFILYCDIEGVRQQYHVYIADTNLQSGGIIMADKKTYTITFKAELTEEDLRVMNKGFYDAMNEALDIYDVWGLDIVED